MTPESACVLTIPELRLCMQVMRFSQWNDLPLIGTGEPTEQRVMNAFLNLVRTGKFVATDSGYVVEPEFRKLMKLIGEAQTVYCIWEGEEIAAFLYRTNAEIAVIVPDAGGAESCKLLTFQNTEPEQIPQLLARYDGIAYVDPVLREADGSGEEIRDHKALARFIRVKMYREEAE